MSIAETIALTAESTSIRARISSFLLPVGIGFALVANAAWVALLGYCILKLV